jgi:hypothetical protein
MTSVAQLAAEDQERAAAADWAERRRVHREQRWRLIEAALGRVAEMLDAPLFRDELVEAEGGTMIMRSPVGWNLGTAARLLATVDQLARAILAEEGNRPRIVLSPERLQRLSERTGKPVEEIRREIMAILADLGVNE